jgi:TRAP transporter TAXI family solute receptor
MCVGVVLAGLVSGLLPLPGDGSSRGALAQEATAEDEDTGAYVLRLATGTVGEQYWELGQALSLNLSGAYQGARPMVQVQLVETSASLENLQKLQDGEVNAAFVQADVAYSAWRSQGAKGGGEADLQAVGALYPEALHAVVRKEVGAKTLSDLKRRRVAVGAAGSGTRATATTVLAAHGVGPEVSQLVHMPDEKLEEALRSGEIDAALLVGAIPSLRINQLLALEEVELVPVDQPRMALLASRGAVIRPAVIPAGSYAGVDRDIETSEVRALLLVSPEVPGLVVAELIVNLTRADARKQISVVHPAMGAYDLQDTAADIPVPLHNGAMKYYRSARVYPRPVEVYTGMLLMSVAELDIKNGSFTMDFYLWFRWRGRIDVQDNELAFEIVNGHVEQSELTSYERYAGWTYLCYRVIAQMRGNFLLHNYPFDRQTISVQIEPPDYGTEELVFIPDDLEFDGAPRELAQQALNPGLTISDWRIEGVRQRVAEFLYPTDFGSPYEAVQGQVPYSRYVFELELGRVLLPYVVKFVVPLVIIVSMAFMVFFIHPKEFEVQAGIVITALLSCVAFHISQADALPEVGYLVTADKFFLISYLVIFFALVQVVVENHFFHTRGLEAALRIDRWSRVVFPLVFFLPIGYIFVVGG